MRIYPDCFRKRKNFETDSEDVVKNLKRLSEHNEIGVITQDEFELKEKEYLVRM